MAWGAGRPQSHTAQHRAWARAVKRAARGRCQINGPRCTGVAVHADHIIPVAEGGAEYDLSNGQGACEPCHDEKTRQEAARGRQRYYGAARRPPEPHPGLV